MILLLDLLGCQYTEQIIWLPLIIHVNLHIPRNTITLRINELPPDHPLMVMCHSGVRSTQVQAWLAENSSENAINLVGGISAWSEKIDQSFHNISFWFNAI